MNSERTDGMRTQASYIVQCAYDRGYKDGLKDAGIESIREITDADAIEHLQQSGWLSSHDREMMFVGMRQVVHEAMRQIREGGSR